MTWAPTATALPSGGTYQVLAGIPGGIPDTSLWPVYDVTQAPYNADATGVVDASAAIQSAVDDAVSSDPDGAVIYLPGTFRIDTTVTAQAEYNFDNINHNLSLLIKGDGPDATIINSAVSAGAVFRFTGGTGETGFYSITSGTPARGDTSFDLSSVTSIEAGQYIIVRRDNAEAYESPSNPENAGYMVNARSQIVKVTNVAGSTVTFSPALNEGHLSDSVTIIKSQCQRSGVEGLKIDKSGTSGTHNIQFTNCFECWVRNVESQDAVKWHIRLEASANCELRENYVHDGPGGGGDSIYGYGLYQYCCNNLIENNIAERTRHAYILEYGGQNNVFGYNYSKDPINEGQLTTDFLMGDLITHGGEPAWNLFEGNTASIVRLDNILGGSQYITAFRNQITRKSIPTVIYGCRAFESDAYNLDNSGIGLVFEEPPASYVGDTYYWGTPSSESRTLIHGVYDLETDVTTWKSGEDQTLPDSLYLTSKPAWWDSSPAWPSIGPDLADKFGENPAYRRGNPASNMTNPDLTITQPQAALDQIKADCDALNLLGLGTSTITASDLTNALNTTAGEIAVQKTNQDNLNVDNTLGLTLTVPSGDFVDQFQTLYDNNVAIEAVI